MNRLVRAVCGFALGAVLTAGCTDGGGSSGGAGSAGAGGLGAAGSGGDCDGLGGGVPIECIMPPGTMCQNTAVEPIIPCCEPPAPPAQEVACSGAESTENPRSCTPTGMTLVYQLTSLKVAADCNVGFNLDACYGVTACIPQPLASEGVDGVDNGVATLEGHGAINQLFADAICGSTDDQGLGCDTAIPKLDIELAIETNPEERCANVAISANDNEVGRQILNLGDPTPADTRCVSGWLGAVPITLGDTEIVLQSWAVRMTVSDAGFSDGLLGATLNAEDAVSLAEATIPSLGADIGQFFDIPHDLRATGCACDALSGTYEIGGVAEK